MTALDSFERTAPCQPWINYYMAAYLMYGAGRQDASVGWLYVGQIHARVAGAFGASDGASAVMASLNSTIGPVINQHAGADRDKWLAAIDWAIAWDEQHPITLETLARAEQVTIDVPPQEFDRTYSLARERLRRLRSYVANLSSEELRRMRRENGIE